MGAALFGRDAELATVGRVLDEHTSGPTVLSVHGEAGIGKSSLLREVRDLATARSYRVLAGTPTSAEARWSYSGLTDLLDPLVALLPDLPAAQHLALDAVMLRGTVGTTAPDVRTVCAGTLGLLTRAARQQPLLVAVDDAQWLDEPTIRALTYAVRRCVERLVLVATVRDGFDDPLRDVVPDPRAVTSIALGGLGRPELRSLLADRLDASVDPAVVRRIEATSRGNPLFALELARTLDPDGRSRTAFPSALTVSMRSTFAGQPERTRDVLLTCSALAAPTAAVLARAGIVDAGTVLVPAERAGMVRWRGDRLEFAHPMWREVVYGSADPASLRAVHRRLAVAAADVEERARHSALGEVGLSPATRAALEQAAASARNRGAPSAAAALLQLALDRGARSPALRLAAAVDHFEAGEHADARALATTLVDETPPGPVRAAARAVLAHVAYLEEDFATAVAQLESAVDDAGSDAVTQSGLAIDLAFSCINVGDVHRGRDWAVRAEASARATGEPAVVAEATGAVALLGFLTGSGVDEVRLTLALAAEDPVRPSPAARWPTLDDALVRLWSHDLERARAGLAVARARYDDLGFEAGRGQLLARVAEAAVLAGDLAEARASVAELSDRAALDGDGSTVATALASRVVLASWSGDAAQAHEEHARLLEHSHGVEHLLPRLAASAALGSLALASSQPGAAVEHLEPVADVLLLFGVAEPVVTWAFPDAVDAWVATGRPDRAVPLVELFEEWGARAGTPWVQGVGCRGRAQLLLAGGDPAGAGDSLRRALAAFERIGSRYELARTHLVVASWQRRRRMRAAARASLEVAARLFREVGAAAWAANAEQQRDGLGVGSGRPSTLTPSERRVAELAGSGLTNGAVAARLAISPKTVEAHLASAYRKLGIRSRAELGRWLADGAPAPDDDMP
ncbi:LuxR family transcriptional regulator [Cellulomonas chitinilytica]|uniref:LuxR family transcriptional regulator n=1 Tax=Cellulomonas chitinilytica TaxID=398759 RepID=A0A919P3B1_9CELL|nr:LuxR family transcriptional regulator [Cellulomonas chitinilytica]GIG21103.1 LuxR family transcriptional regulator [Cellulomonas chitinilytica]